MAVSPLFLRAPVSTKTLASTGITVANLFLAEECIDLQYMKAQNNNPAGLYSCAGLGNTGAGDKGINWPLDTAT